MHDSSTPVPWPLPTPPTPTPPVEWVTVTPEVAAEMLTHNRGNRAVRAKLDVIVRDMKAGAFTVETGATIVFARDGTLLDGQHRLMAVVKSGVTLDFLVVRGVSKSVQKHIDLATPRTFADTLTFAGESEVTKLAALISITRRWEAGAMQNNKYMASRTELMEHFTNHPEFREITRKARRLRVPNLPHSMLGLAIWLFDQIDTEDSNHFFARLHDGQGLMAGDPIYELRRVLSTPLLRGGRMMPTYKLAITIKAWNAYRQGGNVGLLRWRQGGVNPEKMPVPV